MRIRSVLTVVTYGLLGVTVVGAVLAPDMVTRHAILRPEYIEECRRHLDEGEFLAAKRLVVMAALHVWIESNGGTL